MLLPSVDGPTFLGIYAVLLAAATGASYAILRAPRRAHIATATEPPALPAEEIAYLAGGADAAVASGLSSLASRALVTYESKTHHITAVGRLPDSVTAFEATVHDALRGRPASPLAVRDRLERRLDAVRAQLVSTGLLLPPHARLRLRVRAAAPLSLVLLLGLVRMLTGIDNRKPVLILGVLLLVGLLALVVTIASVPERTTAGHATLGALRRQHAALEVTARARSNALSPNELGLAVGLFGIAVLNHTAHAPLSVILTPASASGGSSCGSDGDGGGGGCGGGCGGCS